MGSSPNDPGRRRSPRRADGRRRDGPVAVSEALAEVAGRLGMERPSAVATVFGHWEELVGPAVAAHARPLRVEGSTLVVVVDHPAWATELRHLAPDLLSKVAERLGPAQGLTGLDVRVRR